MLWKFHKVVLGVWVLQERCFSVLTASECTNFKWIWLRQAGFESLCFLWVSSPLNPHSQNDKVQSIGAHHLSKCWGIYQKQSKNSSFVCFSILWTSLKLPVRSVPESQFWHNARKTHSVNDPQDLSDCFYVVKVRYAVNNSPQLRARYSITTLQRLDRNDTMQFYSFLRSR